MQPVFTTASWIQLTYSHVLRLRPSLISCRLRLGHSGGVFPSVVYTKIPYVFLIWIFVSSAMIQVFQTLLLQTEQALSNLNCS
jgi:hypothetical protein